MTTPTIQHWLTSVARTAGLPGAEGLDIASDTATAAAWVEVTRVTGVDDVTLAGAVAEHFRLDPGDVGEADPQAHRLVPAPLARRLGVLPLSCSDRTLVVATADPVSLEGEREIGRISDRAVVFRVAPPARIREAIEAAYGDGEEARHEVPALGPDVRGVRRILVVEDEPETRLLLRSVLEREEYEVYEAGDGESALEVLDDVGGFHLLTLDLKLPGINGLEVLEKIRRRPRWRHLPVIVATGHGDPDVEVRLFEAGADDFVVKPVDPRRFILRVQAVLRRRAVAEDDAGTP